MFVQSRQHPRYPLLRTLASMLVVIAMLLATAIVGVPAAQAANTYEIGSAQAPVLKDDTEITIDGKP